MDRYQRLASGEDPNTVDDALLSASSSDDYDPSYDHPDPNTPHSSHKIGTIGAALLIIASVVLDIISIADVLAVEVPVADIIALIFSVILFLYFAFVGVSNIRSVVSWVLAWVVELVPGVDWLPLYLIGIILIIAIDRSETASRVANAVGSKLPTPKAGAGRAASGVAQREFKAANNLSRNKVFGAASETSMRKAQELQEKVPGILRKRIFAEDVISKPKDTDTTTLPPSPGTTTITGPEARPESRTTGGETYTRASSSSTTPSGRSQKPSDTSSEIDPFGTYAAYERENLPRLEDIVDVDVSGQRTTERPGGPGGGRR